MVDIISYAPEHVVEISFDVFDAAAAFVTVFVVVERVSYKNDYNRRVRSSFLLRSLNNLRLLLCLLLPLLCPINHPTNISQLPPKSLTYTLQPIPLIQQTVIPIIK